MDTKDIYTEFIVRRTGDGGVLVKKALIILGVIVVPLVVIFIQALTFIAPAIALLAIWFGYKLFRMQDVENEYIVTNGEMDIDKIMGRMNRKRVLTVDARKFEVFAPMDEAHRADYTSHSIAQTYDVSASKNSPDRWFALFEDSGGKRTLLIIEYSQKVVAALTPFLPRHLQFNR